MMQMTQCIMIASFPKHSIVLYVWMSQHLSDRRGYHTRAPQVVIRDEPPVFLNTTITLRWQSTLLTALYPDALYYVHVAIHTTPFPVL